MCKNIFAVYMLRYCLCSRSVGHEQKMSRLLLLYANLFDTLDWLQRHKSAWKRKRYINKCRSLSEQLILASRLIAICQDSVKRLLSASTGSNNSEATLAQKRDQTSCSLFKVSLRINTA